MMKILCIALLLIGLDAFGDTQRNEASFNKVKNVYIAHMEKKIIFMSEMTTCMAQSKDFEDLKICSKKGKSKIAALEKKAHEAHMKAQEKRKAKL